MYRSLSIALALVLTAAAGAVVAQYPVKPIRLIVGFPPGGSADPTTRIMGAALAEQMGQPVVVENRPGADSALAAEQVTRLPADGYTLMFASNSAMTAAVALRKQAPYDPLADFTPISMVGRATVFLYVHPAVPAATLKEFVEYARANPGKLNYGTGNPLSILYNVQLMSATGISMVHVPYKGEGPLNPDILAGRVQSSFLSTGTAVSYAKDGRLRALAVLHERRSPLLPDVPTIVEAGVPAVTVRQWAGLFGPPKMPREIVERLNKEVNAALKRPDVLEKLQGYGYAAEGSTPERLLRDQPRRPRAVAEARARGGHPARVAHGRPFPARCRARRLREHAGARADPAHRARGARVHRPSRRGRGRQRRRDRAPRRRRREPRASRRQRPHAAARRRLPQAVRRRARADEARGRTRTRSTRSATTS